VTKRRNKLELSTFERKLQLGQGKKVAESKNLSNLNLGVFLNISSVVNSKYGGSLKARFLAKNQHT
jgi:hypothetical protein